MTSSVLLSCFLTWKLRVWAFLIVTIVFLQSFFLMIFDMKLCQIKTFHNLQKVICSPVRLACDMQVYTELGFAVCCCRPLIIKCTSHSEYFKTWLQGCFKSKKSNFSASHKIMKLHSYILDSVKYDKIMDPDLNQSIKSSLIHSFKQQENSILSIRRMSDQPFCAPVISSVTEISVENSPRIR